MKKILLIVVALVACSPSSVEEFRWEGRAQALALAEVLQKVETAEDLERLTPKIKKRLDKLTDLMMAAHHYLEKHPEAQPDPEPNAASERLKEQLLRIYAMDGGQEAFEAISAGALQKLQLNLH